ncbi:MAG: metallophosphoesterase [Anaerovoracaceae bacterium]|nr:metallophosphoesterase [Bacillota bacterium]MDY2670362.1 metallophosphoesterase [Anaerovoracaceae bacterium]
MNIFALADLHLGLAVDKPMNVFGARWNDHTEKMRKSWDGIVGSDDVVIISGDVSWGLKLSEAMPDLQWIHERPGKKIISKGNHDLWWTTLTKLNALYDDIVFIQNGCAVVGNTAVCGTRGWMLRYPGQEWTEHDEKIFRRELIRMKLSLDAAVKSVAENIILSLHYPPTDYEGSETPVTEIIDQYDVTCVLYGHLHGSDAEKNAFRGKINGTEYRLVSSDTVGFIPQLILTERRTGDE